MALYFECRINKKSRLFLGGLADWVDIEQMWSIHSLKGLSFVYTTNIKEN